MKSLIGFIAIIFISMSAFGLGSNLEVKNRNDIVIKTGASLTERARFDASGDFAVTSLSTSTALYADGNKKIKSSSVTYDELNRVSGVTSNIQTQLDAKLGASVGSVSTANILNSTILNEDIASGTIDLAAKVTGVLPLANGGTGGSTSAAAVNNLLPSQGGNSGKFLTTNGSSLSWGDGGGAGSCATYTATFTNFTVNSQNMRWCSIIPGVLIYISGRASFSAGSGAEARVSLPNSYVGNSTYYTGLEHVGTYVTNQSATEHGGVMLIDPSVGYMMFSPKAVFSGNSATALTRVNGNDIGGVDLTINAMVFVE